MNCNIWECVKLDSDGMCEETDGDCIGDMCEDFQTCGSCSKQNGEDCPKY